MTVDLTSCRAAVISWLKEFISRAVVLSANVPVLALRVRITVALVVAALVRGGAAAVSSLTA